MNLRTLTALALLLLTAGAAAAEKHAVLIGIGKYSPPVQKLHGPANDVEALRHELIESWGFDPGRVRSLVDRRATKAAILAELDRLAVTTQAGDFIFLFYAGHGTSAFDEDLRWQGVELGKWTGALVPYDYNSGPPPGHDRSEWTDRLVIGRRDLRPRLERLDRNRNIFAVFDTCFSGNSVRSITQRPVRWVSPATPVRSPRSISRLEDPFDDDPIFGAATAREQAYPYDRLIYLSAARKFERAEELFAWETIDGRPHGSLTNALLRGLRGDANADRDRLLTYRELYRYVRDQVNERDMHMPQLLYPESRPDLVERGVFEHQPLPPSEAPPVTAYDGLLVRLGPNLWHLRRPLAGLDRVRVVDRGEYHVALESEGDGRVALYHRSGDRIAGGFAPRSQALLRRIARQAQVQALIDLAYPRQDFDLDLDLAGRSGYLYRDQPFEIAAGTDRSAVLVLLNIDKAGTVSVLYPASAAEMRPTRTLYERFEVIPPYGTEYLKLLAFRHPPDGLDRWLRRKVDALDPQFDELVELFLRAAGDRAQARLKVVTVGELTSGRPATGVENGRSRR